MYFSEFYNIPLEHTPDPQPPTVYVSDFLEHLGVVERGCLGYATQGINQGVTTFFSKKNIANNLRPKSNPAPVPGEVSMSKLVARSDIQEAYPLVSTIT